MDFECVISDVVNDFQLLLVQMRTSFLACDFFYWIDLWTSIFWFALDRL